MVGLGEPGSVLKVSSLYSLQVLRLTHENSSMNSVSIVEYTGLKSRNMASALILDSVKELLLDRPTEPGAKKKIPAFGVQVPLFYGRENVQMNNYDQVYPSIYLGNVEITQDKETLQQIQATHILNAAQGTKFNQINLDENFYADLHVKFLGFPAVDIFTYKISKHFSEAADFIDGCLKENGTIVVYCQQGISRSASLVLAFLMMKRQMNLTEAINTVKAKRPIFPNEGFLKQLIELENQLHSSKGP